MRQKKTKPQPRNLLTLKPTQARQSETDEAGNEVILIPRFGNHRLGRWLTGRTDNKFHKLSLDELGTFVWRRLDGQTTLQTIGQSMREKFGEGAEPVYDRLGLYVKQMIRAKLIHLPDEEPS